MPTRWESVRGTWSITGCAAIVRRPWRWSSRRRGCGSWPGPGASGRSCRWPDRRWLRKRSAKEQRNTIDAKSAPDGRFLFLPAVRRAANPPGVCAVFDDDACALQRLACSATASLAALSAQKWLKRSRLGHAKGIAQRLKPSSSRRHYGPAEASPFPRIEFFRTPGYRCAIKRKGSRRSVWPCEGHPVVGSC